MKRKQSDEGSKETIKKQKLIEDGIKFLEEKGVLSDDPENRKMQFDRIIHPDVLSETLRPKYKKIRERLLRLTQQSEETHLDEVPNDIHKFSMNEFPGYENEDVFILKYPQSLVQRYQLSGLCYMHAPAVVQYYAISKSLSGSNHKQMIDLLNMVKGHFTAKELEHHIFDDRGGSSAEFLKKILEPNTVLITNIDIPSGFKKYGVGLVSSFGVYDDFKDTTKHQHYGKPSGSFVGHHAMAIVGFRKDGDKLFFLLQNWWKMKQFVEVDEEYLKNSGASVHFIETPQNLIPKDFSTHSGHFFELELIDKPEGFTGEMKY